jgi:hypothetical protein
LGEHQAGSLGAVGSNPSSSTIQILHYADFKAKRQMEDFYFSNFSEHSFVLIIGSLRFLAIFDAPLYIKKTNGEEVT